MKRYFFYIIFLSLAISGCEINQSEILPEDGFTKIFNHPEEGLTFYPESVVELSDGGIIFLCAVKDESAEIEYPYTYIVKTSAKGEMLWAQSYSWYAPSSSLIQQENTIGFVAMNAVFDAYLIIIDPETGAETKQYDLEMTMPLSSYIDAQGKLVVLGFDYISRSSWISLFSSSFNLERSILLSINTEVGYDIQRHLNKTGQPYPFFISEYNTTSSSGYIVNCLSNYTLRSIFLDGANLGSKGDIYSYRTEEGISSMIQKDGDIFGLTSYYEGKNYILPDATIDVSSSQNIKDMDGAPLYELTFKAGVLAGTMSADSLDYALFISQTNSNALVIYQYAMNSDTLVATHYKNFDDKLDVSEYIQTSDKGVLILSSTYIAGKYRRPMLIKIPEASFIPEVE